MEDSLRMEKLWKSNIADGGRCNKITAVIAEVTRRRQSLDEIPTGIMAERAFLPSFARSSTKQPI